MLLKWIQLSLDTCHLYSFVFYFSQPATQMWWLDLHQPPWTISRSEGWQPHSRIWVSRKTEGGEVAGDSRATMPAPTQPISIFRCEEKLMFIWAITGLVCCLPPVQFLTGTATSGECCTPRVKLHRLVTFILSVWECGSEKFWDQTNLNANPGFVTYNLCDHWWVTAFLWA